MKMVSSMLCLLIADAALGSAVTRRQEASATASAPATTKISSCHLHATKVFCEVGTQEFEIVRPTPTTAAPAAEYTGCHNHGSELFCMGPGGEEVEVLTGTEDAHDDHDHSAEDGHDQDHSSESGSGATPEGTEEECSCHSHAGVEHCVHADGSTCHKGAACSRQDRDYNIPLRIGLLFVILVTSFIGVSAPIFLTSILPSRASIVFQIAKQFGTGIILSTAFVHLYTHASLMFGNECLKNIHYEATTSAVVMAGIFLSFLIDYICNRVLKGAGHGHGHGNDSVASVMVLEAGILFHSLLIGLTLVVAGDSFFITLFIVILFHQLFEGLALGTRIASLRSSPKSTDLPITETTVHPKSDNAAADSASEGTVEEGASVSFAKKIFMALAFALITPLGMAIGIGVLKQFNGNDPSTLIALGTLDSFSAGILIWVGLVEMLAHDWLMPHGDLTNAKAGTACVAGVALVAGMALMSLLGKWA